MQFFDLRGIALLAKYLTLSGFLPGSPVMESYSLFPHVPNSPRPLTKLQRAFQWLIPGFFGYGGFRELRWFAILSLSFLNGIVGKMVGADNVLLGQLKTSSLLT